MFRRFRPSLVSLTCAAVLGLPLVAQAAGAPGCAGFKSGNYVAMNALDSDTAWRVNLLSINAETLVVTDREGSRTLGVTANPCEFSLPSGGSVMVSKKGIFVVRGDGGGTPFVSLGLPLQKSTLKTLVGSWNFLRHERGDDGLMHTSNGTATVNSKGRLDVAVCDPVGSTCAAPAKVGQLTVNAEGGFDLTTGWGVERFFAVKLADGSKLMAGVGLLAGGESMTVLAPPTPRVLPAVGDKWGIWDIQVAPNGTVSPASPLTFKVTAVDAATGTFQRKRLEDCRLETWAVNTGRDGLAYRQPGTSKLCDKVTKVTIRKNLSMSLRESFGFTAYGWESTDPTEPRYFGLNIIRP